MLLRQNKYEKYTQINLLFSKIIRLYYLESFLQYIELSVLWIYNPLRLLDNTYNNLFDYILIYVYRICTDS